MSVWSFVATAISKATGCNFTLKSKTPVAGGSISSAFRLESIDGRRYFLKLNTAKYHPMFLAEVAGLEAISATQTLLVPRPIALGVAVAQSFLILEFLNIHPLGDSILFGEQLARMHRYKSEQFGFSQDNFIGATPQHNTWKSDWITFWRDQRLGFQLHLAAENGYGSELQRLGRNLQDVLPAYFDNYSPEPSLLHGDLWNGNCAFLKDGTPVLFDPANYFGDRECDVAMTELFGGFAADFYTSYNAVWPLDYGYPLRRDLYNLYHLLNHGNLFGREYMLQAELTMKKLLRSRG